MVGVEGSPALAAAARTGDPGFEVHVADAAALPLQDGSADLVVASMVLLNLDDLAGSLREAARVLEPGGRLCFSIVHPFNSLKALPSYFEQRAYPETRERGGLRMTFHDTHRPLAAYARALEDAGLLIEALREPRPDDAYVADHPEVAGWLERPCFLLARAVKPATVPAAG